LHQRALRRFGPVDAELLGVGYLDELAGRQLRWQDVAGPA